ncbi:hypothetical protein GCM10009741_09610 [Kribbella lupini]|uniref:Metalloprotease n=1 Tax=Kribbella lupini TaxID=291602 RepID=A0ABP4L4P5_9ACTN
MTERYDRDVTFNPLYRVGRIAASQCKEPAVRPTSVANVRAYYTQSVACLNKVWGPAIRKAGYPFTPPELVVHAGQQPANVCQVSDKAAYCANVIYMDANADIADYRAFDRMWVRTRMSFLIGHEYGHHVQDLVGIMRSSYSRASYAASTDGRLTESRRRELQASCLSGVYLGGDRSFFPAKGAWLTKWRWLVRNRGDAWNPTRSHGSPTNHAYWSLRGFNTADPAACNTFTGPPARVA